MRCSSLCIVNDDDDDAAAADEMMTISLRNLRNWIFVWSNLFRVIIISRALVPTATWKSYVVPIRIVT